MATSSVSGTLASPGISSGLDVTSIVSQLVAIEERPVNDLKTKAANFQSELSSFGLLKSYMSNLHDIAAEIAKPDFWTQTTANSADASSVSVTSTNTATAGNYAVDVSQLAQSQSLASKPFADSTTPVGSGVLHIQFGSWNAGMTTFTPNTAKTSLDLPVTIPDNSVDAIKSKINAANAGVTASVIRDASGARLVIRSTDTGETSSVRITATDDDGNNTNGAGLSALAFDPSAGVNQMTQTQVATNAKAKINGLDVTSESNTLSNVVDGVTMTLNKVTTSSVAVSVATDTATQSKAINDFAKAYNDISSYIAQQTAYDAASKTGGPLQGDRATLTLQNNLRSLVTGSSFASSAFAHLSDVGLQMQKDGTLNVDSSKLTAAFTNNPDELKNLFANTGLTDPNQQGFAVRMQGLADQLLGSDGLLTTHTKGLQDDISRNSDQQTQMQARVDQIQARLTKQYSDLDATLSQIKSQSSILTQSLAALTASTSTSTSK